MNTLAVILTAKAIIMKANKMVLTTKKTARLLCGSSKLDLTPGGGPSTGVLGGKGNMMIDCQAE